MIIVDTREQANSFVIRYFEENIIPYTEKKLDEGDYKLEGQDNIVIERKQDLLELAGNVCSKDHQRFKRELLRAQEKGIKIYVLVGSKSCKTLEDVKKWKSKYTKVKGSVLYKALKTIQERYGVEYVFAKECHIGYEIERILNYKGGKPKVHIENDFLIIDSEIIKRKKITGTKFPVLLGLNNYKTRGKEVLQLFGLVPNDDVDPFYAIRGEIAEQIAKKVLEERGFICKTWDKKEIEFDNFKYNKDFGGMIDIAITSPARIVVEVKSKNIKKYEDIKKYGNKSEEKQGDLYATLCGTDCLMVWVFFNDKTEDLIRKGLITNSEQIDINGTDENGIKNVTIYTKMNVVNKDKVYNEMTIAKLYVDTCFDRKKIPLKDLDEKTLESLGLSTENFKEELPF